MTLDDGGMQQGSCADGPGSRVWHGMCLCWGLGLGIHVNEGFDFGGSG